MENKPDKLNYRDMNLRDHFAARAMQGMLGGDTTLTFDNLDETYIKRTTFLSYQIADKMIAQREIATLQPTSLKNIVNSLNFALTYIDYVKDHDFALHKEAVGTPNTEDHIVETLKGLNDLRS